MGIAITDKLKPAPKAMQAAFLKQSLVKIKHMLKSKIEKAKPSLCQTIHQNMAMMQKMLMHAMKTAKPEAKFVMGHIMGLLKAMCDKMDCGGGESEHGAAGGGGKVFIKNENGGRIVVNNGEAPESEPEPEPEHGNMMKYREIFMEVGKMVKEEMAEMSTLAWSMAKPEEKMKKF